MNPERIKQLVDEKRLIVRIKDIPRIKSLLGATERLANAAMNLELKEENATIIFKEIYDGIRQLGDARWLLTGYEVMNSHGLSMEILKEEKVKESAQLQNLERFRETRRAASYNGYIINVEQAKAIIEFWRICGKEMLENLKKEVT